MSKFNMAAEHAIRPVSDDVIFGASIEAHKAIARDGFNNVINSTIGALLDDDGKLVTFNSVFNTLRDLKDENISAYAPLSGMPEYLSTSIKATFGKYQPEGFVDAIATPGGSGAIRHAIWNYTNYGDEILTSDWFWDPYNTIASEHGRKISTYQLFDEENNFNIDSFESRIDQLLNKQDRLLIIINSPAHNPTGFSLSYEEWDKVIDILKEKSNNTNNKIILFVDVAYIDFCDESARKFFGLLGSLPINILSLVAFSMSKGYTFYGLRSGSIIGVSSSEEVIKEFKNVCSHSNRGVWSNGTRSAMEVLVNIFKDEEILKVVVNERNKYKNILKNRAQTFITNSNEVELNICPYKDGFFISIPTDNPVALSNELNKRNVFLVPLAKGLRFAVCSVSEEKCEITPKLIKEAMANI
ncbi:MAG: aminotransferase class I/II-fold pyridoxal phosphate-dependent enzyme [Eubacteriaceae bacterium]